MLRWGEIWGLALVFAACGLNAPGQEMPAGSQALPAAAQQLFAMANESRAEAGAGRLVWDPALAQAAMQHCLRMTEEGPLSHQYRGEADLATRAKTAGARFGLIEENIAFGSRAAGIHEGWLESPGHRANLLNPEVNRIGVAVIASQGVIFAVEDFSRGVPALTAAQAEGIVAGLVRAERVPVSQDARDARAACGMDSGVPASADPRPRFIFRWQGAELNRLPPELVRMLASRRYTRAAVGNCPADSGQGQFTTYRMAVLLY